MAYKAESITVQMSAGQRVSALNHIAALRTMMHGDCGNELKRFMGEMRNTHPQYEQNNRAMSAIFFFLANINKERHNVEYSELTSDEITALIGAMNHFRAVVSLFPKKLTLPN